VQRSKIWIFQKIQIFKIWIFQSRISRKSWKSGGFLAISLQDEKMNFRLKFIFSSCKPMGRISTFPGQMPRKSQVLGQIWRGQIWRKCPFLWKTGTGKDLGPFFVEKRAGSTEFLQKLRAMVGLGQFCIAKLAGSARFCRNGHWKHFGPDFRKRKSGLEAKNLRFLAGIDRNPGFQDF